MTRYVIADVMLFDDELYEISDPGGAYAPVVLGAAASRCFSTLLEAQGSIVTKKELLYEGWERYGQQVSANSVNQSVAQIRRCLSSLGFPDYVVTVPRIGYKISDAVGIVKAGENLLLQVGSVVSVVPEERPRPIETGALSPRVTEREGGNGYVYMCLMGVLLLNAFMALGWQSIQLSSPLVTAIDFTYFPVPSVQNFHLYAAPGLSLSPDRINAHLTTLQRYPPGFTSLASDSYVYLNGALQDNVYSYFLCHGPIEVGFAGCVSYFVVEEGAQ